eukprot:scaffold193438_cov60-Cyclotella_meneghiniana.AAC.2
MNMKESAVSSSGRTTSSRPPPPPQPAPTLTIINEVNTASIGCCVPLMIIVEFFDSFPPPLRLIVALF